mgnify:CR=1 FL=1|jgi:hypothetical protein
MEYYHKMHIAELKTIQSELYFYVKDLVEAKSRYFIGKYVPYDELHHFPTLINYLSNISKLPIHKTAPIKFFITGPGVKGSIHMDYDTTSRIALNIPVIGYERTFLRYYETSEENIVLLNPNPAISQGYSYIPKDLSLVTLIKELEFIEPHLVRTDKLHQSFNPTNKFRVIVTIRWEASRDLTEFEDFVYI